MRHVHDVIVVGAGPGGSAAAYYLARSGLDVLLVDKHEFPRDKTCGDGLPPLALRVLDDMGLLPSLRRLSHRINAFDLVAPNGQSVVVSLPTGQDGPDYSLIVPRLTLDNTLRQHAMAAGATFESPIHVTDVTPGERGVTVVGEHRGRATAIEARVAILATGASPTLQLRLGLLSRRPSMTLAARAYFEGLASLTDRAQIRFDGVPLPGYGWVFPLSDSSANVGAGFWTGGLTAHQMPKTAAAAFEQFVRRPPVREMLRGGQQVGPIKGYPLRTDFATAPTCGDRVLLVGEAAGLVNPLTGEGVDFALESGRLAAAQVAQMFADGDLSPQRVGEYDRLLRRRFQRQFEFCGRVRDVLVHPALVDLVVRLLNDRPDLKTWLTNVVLGNEPAPGPLATIGEVASRLALRR